MVKEDTINVTFTLDKQIVAWLKNKAKTDDVNQSQIARRVFRRAMTEEARLEKIIKKGVK